MPELAIEGFAADTEQFSGFFTVPLRLRKGLADRFLLGFGRRLSGCLGKRYLPGSYMAYFRGLRLRANPPGQVGRRDGGTAGDRHRAVNTVLQFSNVPRPFISHEQLKDILRNIRLLDPQRRGIPFEEMLHQKGNIFFALAQWADIQTQNVESPIQVLPEASGLDHPSQVVIRRRHHAHVDGNRFITAHA